MNEQSPPKQKMIFVLMLFALIFSKEHFKVKNYLHHRWLTMILLVLLSLQSITTHAQTPPNPVFFTWENEVGCMEGEVKNRSYVEAIAAGVCHIVCQGSTVKYTLHGTGLSNTVWTVVGGTIMSQSVSQCVVKWSTTVSTGAIGVSTNTPTGNVNLIPLCVKMKTSPSAFFGKDGQEITEDPLIICRNTTVNFTNLSTDNGGTPINASYWDFADGGTSTEINPSYTFTVPGEYRVLLKVTNQCYCTSTYTHTIVVTEERAIEITCPTVVCEGQTATYSISDDYQCEKYNWSVDGGTIISNQPYTSTIEVLWEPQNEDGFGYVTFDPRDCEVECFKPTTVKIPVIATEGDIIGKYMICGSAQELYKLPQWPTTDFQWTIVNSGGANASLVLTGQRNEVMINSGNQGGSFTLTCNFVNTLLKCGGTASITVQIRVPAIIQGNSVVCLQESGTTEVYDLEGGHTAKWKWRLLPNGPWSPEIEDTSVNPQFLTAGDYSITASGSIFCKTETFIVKVIDPAAINPAGLLTSTIICPSTPTTFEFTNSVPNSELYWSVTGGSIIGANSGNSIEVVFNYPTTQSYSLKIKRLVNGCFSPELVIPLTLPVIPNNIMGATALLAPVVETCGSTSQTYTMPFTGADSYTWRVDPASVGSISTANGTNTVTVLWNEYSAPTPATLYVDVNHCGIITPRSIGVIVGSPVITMTPITSPICSQNSHPFSIVSNPTLYSGDVVWDFGDGGSGSGVTTQHTYDIDDTSPTSYTVTATINNPNGCTTPLVVTQVVNVLLAPVALITPSSYKSECEFSEFDYTEKILVATLQSGYGATTGIQWYKDDVAISGANSYSYFVLGFGTYHVKVTNGTCTSSSNKVVFEQNCSETEECIIVPDPNLALNISGDCGIFTADAYYTGSPTIIWSMNGKVSSTSSTASYAFDKAGYYNIGYQAVYNVGGFPCRVSKSTPITVPYVADLKYKVTCPGTTGGNYTVDLLDTSTYLPFIENLTYLFYVNDDLIPPTSGPQTQRTVTLAPGGTYNLKVVIQELPYAACSKTITLTLPALPDATFTIDPDEAPYCQDTPIAFTVSNPQVGNKYEWSFGTGFTNTQQDPTISYASGGNKTINLTVTNSLGCPDFSEQTIVVTPTNFDGIIEPPINTACANGIVTLTFTSFLDNPDNFQWMNGDQPLSGTQTNPMAVNQSGRYWVKVGTDNGCYKDIYKPVAVSILPPVVPQIAAKNTACAGEIITLNTGFSAAGATYEWVVQHIGGSSIVSTQKVFEYPLLNAGIYQFTLNVKVPNSSTGFCTGTATHTVTVYGAPDEPVITPTLISCQPYRIRLTATSTQPGTFAWSNGVTGTVISSTQNQMFVNEGGPYQVTFTNVSGCSATTAVSVPRSLESYMWIFPTGCLDYCSDKYDGRYLIGPSVMEFKLWEWLIDSTVEATDIEEVDPFPVAASGTYNLTLYNEICSFTSGDLQLQNNECRGCEEVVQVNIVDTTWDTAPFLFYTLEVEITSNLSNPTAMTFTANNTTGIFNPSTVIVQPGTQNYIIQFVPFTTFIPGSKEVTLEFNNEGEPCAIVMFVDFPNTNVLRENNVEKDQLTVAPNPAKHSTTVQYKFVSYQEGGQLLLYDLTGRFLDSYICNSVSGTWNLNTSHLAVGQYVIVMKQQGQVVQQQHLIVKP